MMKKIFSLMLLCTALVFASCSKDDDTTSVAVSGITLDKTTLSIAVGETSTLKATVAPSDATNQTLTWSSDKTSIATVAQDGTVTAVAKGDAIITATSTDGSNKSGSCTVTVTEEPSLTWAAGNLVADGADGVKVGKATDGGLFFQFGSLVGWSTEDPLAVAVSPVGCTVTSWNSSWTGDPTADDAVSGKGDPCRYYLRGTWRLPTSDEYMALFNNVTDYSYANSGGWSWNATAKSATNNTKNLTFPASGYRNFNGGSLNVVGTDGFYWSASPRNASNGYYLSFYSSNVFPSSNYNRAGGLPVRCVK